MDPQSFSLWAPVLAIVGANIALMVTSIGISIALYMHTDKKIDSFKDSVTKEMVDFHKKLCETKNRMDP